MSQETLVSQSSISDSPKSAITWFPARPPSGYEALPYEEPDVDSAEEDSDAELWTLKPASDIEARPVPVPVPRITPASGERDPSTSTSTSTSSNGRSSSPRTRTRMRGVPKMFVILLTAGLPSALFFSALAWLVGGIVLRSVFKVAPYDTMDSYATFKASMAGAPVVALVAGVLAFLDFALRRLPGLRAGPRSDGPLESAGTSTGTAYDPIEDALSISSVCALACVLAMPLGFVMMPHLATEAFGAWHALGWSETGLGVPIGAVVLAFLPQLLWCDAVDITQWIFGVHMCIT